jgi:hypothetical protein
MQQNPWDRETLDQLRDRPKPALPNNFQKQTRLRRMRLKDASRQVCRRARDQARVFWISMKKNQARGNEQCCAASLIVLHARRPERFLLASSGNFFPIRGLSFGGKEFTNVIQFIS